MVLQTLLAIVGLTLGVIAAAHALLFKRRPQSAFGWIAVSLLLPFGGALLYWLFGINRVRTRARKLRDREPGCAVPPEAVAQPPPELEALARLGFAVTGMALVPGNRIAALHNGEQAYPAMLEAIRGARRTVYLATYLFDDDAVGVQFAAALAEATTRGVDVRVILDGIGELYSTPPIHRRLRKLGVRHTLFLPPQLWPPTFHVNLRNHRKMLLVDGDVAFVGGMNLRERHLVESGRRGVVIDMHFRFDGPIVTQIESVFLQDWQFVTGEPQPPLTCAPAGRPGAVCRAIADGPEEELDRLAHVLIGAVGGARERVCLMTPYFLPPPDLLGTLQAAALRGVNVTVILPAKSNLPYVHWATRHMLWELLQYDIRVHYQPPPFVHSKLLVVDDRYSLVGSANIDARSLRLNFELNVEVYDRAFAQELTRHFHSVLDRAAPITLKDVDSRPLPMRLVDGAAWLLSPYL
jgi:cardiolipin synthase